MKANSNIKAGKRQGSPGYRTSAVFRGSRAIKLLKNGKNPDLPRKANNQSKGKP
jgi:hypothetical protein